ncbi:hydroxyacid dehydrogenase [Bosea sp. SSUT16]|uniref:Hydroxyacid dehydrogenase n=1 Tax=Bosea spartocytisi TaxID=2773451 RepID=A0A927I1C0_9HYPH|nr:NAD(P)-dependent oxidoreductase [Bosea spartocytisi]MBD3847421.1 hydroxyacid dehydrogenase [Bosea spartocytisi]MCT4475307.1 hydroxyacid dehydrogenase [Bosea spartocytisi]
MACNTLLLQHDVRCVTVPLNIAMVDDFKSAEAISPFVASRLDAEFIDRLPELKLITIGSAGYDHIDLAACRERGVVIANVPDCGDATAAQHAFALLLALARNIVESVALTRRGGFSMAGTRGLELRDKVIAVVGTGYIGRRTIEIARGFGMRVVAFDQVQDAAAATRLGFTYGPLDEVLAQADVETLHVPSSPSTVGLIGERQFAAMKDRAILINTARGNVVDSEALVRALANGKLRAAGLDVLPQEPLIREEAEIFRQDKTVDASDLKAPVANHVLLRFPNVLVTPHNAYNTDAALARIMETTIANIEGFAADRPINLVEAA